MKGDQQPYPAEIQAILKARYGLRGFERFAGLLGVEIEPFQRYLLRFYFAGVTELVILIPKKNGKSTLLAVLALYHLLKQEDAEVVIGASSREQAALIHRQAERLVENAGLERRAVPEPPGKRRRQTTLYEGVFEIRPGMHVIRFGTGRLRVMPHEARTGDGVIPTLALVDELHRHPDGELYRVWRAGLLKGAQMITISTAGATMDSPLGQLLEKVKAYGMTQVNHRRTYTSPSGGFVLVEWALSAEDDLDDIGLVKKVNPASWLSTDLLRERHPDNSPMESPGSWARLTCNVWTEGDEPQITGPAWDRLAVDIGRVEDGEAVFLAPSVGANAAVAIAAARPGGKVAVRVEHLDAGPGSILAQTEDLIVSLCDRYQVLEAHLPLGGFTRSVEILELRGVPIVEAPHSPTRLVAFSGNLDRLMNAGLLMHDGDPTTRRHMLAAAKKVTETGERYMAGDRSRAVVAIAAATYAATAWAPEPKVLLPSGVG